MADLVLSKTEVKSLKIVVSTLKIAKLLPLLQA
jgi:hypothetical protein